MYQDGRLSEAEALLLKLLPSLPSNGDMLHLLSLIAYQGGRPKEAVTYLRDGARILNQSPHVMNSLGVVLQKVGSNEEAIDVLKQAMEQPPFQSDTHTNLILVVVIALRLVL
jgi:Tfp pilus assembly protein PilF